MRKSPNECFVQLFQNMLRSILVNIRLKNVLYFFKPKGVLLTITFEVKKNISFLLTTKPTLFTFEQFIIYRCKRILLLGLFFENQSIVGRFRSKTNFDHSVAKLNFQSPQRKKPGSGIRSLFSAD